MVLSQGLSYLEVLQGKVTEGKWHQWGGLSSGWSLTGGATVQHYCALHLEGVLILIAVVRKVCAQHRGPLVAHGLCCVHLPPEQRDGAVGQRQV